MSIFTSRSKIIAAGALLIIAGVASASDRQIDGVVQSFDIAEKSVSIRSNESGKVLTYSFSGTPKVDLDGRKHRDLSVLEAGQNVILKFKQEQTVKKSLSVLKGEIRKIDLERSVALIHPKKGGRAQLVTLPRSVAVSGLRSGAGIQALKEGDLVTLKYSLK